MHILLSILFAYFERMEKNTSVTAKVSCRLFWSMQTYVVYFIVCRIVVV